MANLIQPGQLHISDGAPNDFGAFFLSTQDDGVEAALPPDRWLTVRPPQLPRDAKAVLLNGMLIITQSQIASGCNLTVALRAPGYAWEAGYIWQCIEFTPGAGQRSPVGAVVAVRDGAFELKWSKSPAGITPNWPIAPAFAINLAMMGFYR